MNVKRIRHDIAIMLLLLFPVGAEAGEPPEALVHEVWLQITEGVTGTWQVTEGVTGTWHLAYDQLKATQELSLDSACVLHIDLSITGERAGGSGWSWWSFS